MRRSWIASLAGALVIGTALATPAAAHDALVASDPPDGAVLDAAPGAIVLEFTGDILDVNPELQITDQAGELVEVGEAQVDGMVVTWDVLGELAGGQHDVVWVVTSSDGHPIDGELSFSVPASAVTETELAASEETPEAAPKESEAPEATEPSDDATTTPPDDADETVDPADLSNNAEAWFFGGLAVTALVVVAIVVMMRRNRDPNGPPGQH